jgi:hypothetical protein
VARSARAPASEIREPHHAQFPCAPHPKFVISQHPKFVRSPCKIRQPTMSATARYRALKRERPAVPMCQDRKTRVRFGARRHLLVPISKPRLQDRARGVCEAARVLAVARASREATGWPVRPTQDSSIFWPRDCARALFARSVREFADLSSPSGQSDPCVTVSVGMAARQSRPQDEEHHDHASKKDAGPTAVIPRPLASSNFVSN